jgi:hypothetical protein
MDGVWGNITPRLGLEVRLGLAGALALELALAVIWNTHGMLALWQGIKIKTAMKIMGTGLS